MSTIKSGTLSLGWCVVVAALSGASGCGRQVVGVAKPAALVAWEPQPQNPDARITAVKASTQRTYVGFSDGERYFKANGAAAWTSFNEGPAGGCAQLTPKGPVTAFAVTEGTTFTAYAGTPGAPGLWRSPEDHPCWGLIPVSDDFWSLSVSPFSTVELFAVGRGLVWVTHDLAGSWEQNGSPTSFHFDGAVRAVAAGVGPTGAPRAWLGDAAGHLYYSDELSPPTAPDQIQWTALSPDPGFPRRAVVAIAIDPDPPHTVWVTFAGLAPDSLWSSDDGSSWRNPHGGDLAGVIASTDEADAGAGAAASFTAVSPVPGVAAAYVTALAFDRNGNVTTTSLWTTDGSDDWWRL